MKIILFIISYFLVCDVISQDKNYELFTNASFGLNKLHDDDNAVAFKRTSLEIGTSANWEFGIQTPESKKIVYSAAVALKSSQLNIFDSYESGSCITESGVKDCGLSSTYDLCYISIPITVQLRLNERLRAGIGFSYDQIIRNKETKVLNSAPVILKLGSVLDPSWNTLSVMFKYRMYDRIYLIPMVSRVPHKVNNELLSNTASPAFYYDLKLQWQFH
ncbi:MAG: hypothetical protein HOP11_02400 [Saprospiraceae bacterium]|nr:hypothetical protein [Saprospiraceae bacterium]